MKATISTVRVQPVQSNNNQKPVKNNVLGNTLERKGKSWQTLVAVERARELGKLRADAHDLLTAEQLLRDDCRRTTNKVATEVNNDRLTLEHPDITPKTKKKKQIKHTKKRGQKEKRMKTLIVGTLCLGSKLKRTKDEPRKERNNIDTMTSWYWRNYCDIIYDIISLFIIIEKVALVFFLRRIKSTCEFLLWVLYTFLLQYNKRVANQV